MSEEQPTQNITTRLQPIVKLTLNKEAHACATLKDIIEANTDNLFWQRTENGNSYVFDHDDLGNTKCKVVLTKDQVNEVSPLLTHYVNNFFKNRQNVCRMYPDLKTLWRHLHQPGKLISCTKTHKHSREDLQETYFHALRCVDMLDEKKGTFRAVLCGYKLFYKKSTTVHDHGDFSVSNLSEHIHDFKKYNCEITTFEEMFPGFTENVLMANALGCTGEEIALYATSGLLKTPEQPSQSLSMPTL